MELLVFQSAKNNAMIGFDRSLYKVVVVTKTYLPFLKTFDPVVMTNSNAIINFQICPPEEYVYFTKLNKIINAFEQEVLLREAFP